MYDVVQKEKAFVSETEVNDKSGGLRKLFDSSLRSGTRRNLKGERDFADIRYQDLGQKRQLIGWLEKIKQNHQDIPLTWIGGYAEGS